MSFLYELENTLYDNVDKAAQAGLILPDELGKYWMTHNLLLTVLNAKFYNKIYDLNCHLAV